jgi:dTDP-4-amino-4,6-dideoxygalactose transaminase
VNIPFVDLKSQYATIKSEIDAAMADVLTDTAFVGGPYLQKFEEAFASYCGTRHCVGVGNGTDAVFIVLKAMGIGPGDEVITAANSFIATSEAITMAGAQVVFCDIDPSTYNLDIQILEEKITPRTRAIIPVHLYGQPSDMDPIIELATKHELKIVEDAAQAHGGEYKGRRVGTLGDAACFSFYPGKNLGAYGDGGAIVTDDGELAEMMRMFANHGRADKFGHKFEGVNSRLDGLQAAILSVKLNHLENWTEARRKNAYLYNDHLKDTNLVTPVEIEGVRAVYHLYVVRVDAGSRHELQQFLKSHGIATGIHYPIALPDLKAYEYMRTGEVHFPVASRSCHEILSLPIFPELTEEQISHVGEKLKAFQS